MKGGVSEVVFLIPKNNLFSDFVIKNRKVQSESQESEPITPDFIFVTIFFFFFYGQKP